MQVQFFEDQGRFMRDNFHGYRALVTMPDRTRFWADLPEAGAPSYIEVCITSSLQVSLPHVVAQHAGLKRLLTEVPSCICILFLLNNLEPPLNFVQWLFPLQPLDHAQFPRLHALAQPPRRSGLFRGQLGLVASLSLVGLHSQVIVRSWTHSKILLSMSCQRSHGIQVAWLGIH